jgi:hypothetical protein
MSFVICCSWGQKAAQLVEVDEMVNKDTDTVAAELEFFEFLIYSFVSKKCNRDASSKYEVNV